MIKKGNDDVIVCKIVNNVGTVEHMYNPSGVHFPPLYIDTSNPFLGISNANLAYDGSTLTCAFRRDKSTYNFSQYYDLNKPYFILIASGGVDPSKYSNLRNLHIWV